MLQKEKYETTKAAFLEMLKSSDEITGSSRFRDVERIFGADPRFAAVEDQRDRQDFSYDYIDTLDAKEREAKKKKRQEALEGKHRAQLLYVVLYSLSVYSLPTIPG